MRVRSRVLSLVIAGAVVALGSMVIFERYPMITMTLIGFWAIMAVGTVLQLVRQR